MFPDLKMVLFITFVEDFDDEQLNNVEKETGFTLFELVHIRG